MAQYAIIIENELYWMEDSPPPVIEALYQDCLNMNEWIFALPSKKDMHQKRKGKKKKKKKKEKA